MGVSVLSSLFISSNEVCNTAYAISFCSGPIREFRPIHLMQVQVSVKNQQHNGNSVEQVKTIRYMVASNGVFV